MACRMNNKYILTAGYDIWVKVNALPAPCSSGRLQSASGEGDVPMGCYAIPKGMVPNPR